MAKCRLLVMVWVLVTCASWGSVAPRAAAEDRRLTYQVVVSRTEISIKGKREKAQVDTREVVLLCGPSSCEGSIPFAHMGSARVVFELANGSGRASWSRSQGDVCTGDDFPAKAAAGWDVTIDAERLSGTAWKKNFDVQCGSRYAGGSGADLTYTGVLIDGDACVFDAGGCPGQATPTTSPAASTAAASAQPQVPAGPGPAAPGGSGTRVTSSRLGSGDPAAPSVVSTLVPPSQLQVDAAPTRSRSAADGDPGPLGRVSDLAAQLRGGVRVGPVLAVVGFATRTRRPRGSGGRRVSVRRRDVHCGHR